MHYLHMATTLPSAAAPLTAASVFGSTPARPLTDARACPDCAGDGYEVDDGKRCRRCLGHGRICCECYQGLGEYDPAVLADDACGECVSATGGQS